MYITANTLTALETVAAKYAHAVKTRIDAIREHVRTNSEQAINDLPDVDTKPFEGLL